MAACSGFVYGLTTAAHLVSCGSHKKVLVIGADTMSRIIDYTDRSTCVLFGDGAGAMLVEPTEDGEVGFIDFLNEIDGSGGDDLKQPAGGSRMPASAETVRESHALCEAGWRAGLQVRDAKDVRDLARSAGAQQSHRRRHRRADSPSGQPAHHHRRGGAAGNKLRQSGDQYRPVWEHHRRPPFRSPLATRLQSGKVKKGDLVVFAAVGAGYTVGANLWRWEM